MPMGMNMSQMNPAQVAAMRQMRPVSHPCAATGSTPVLPAPCIPDLEGQ